MEKVVTLIRVSDKKTGTEGYVYAGDFRCVSLELPWNNNIVNESCIPVGVYLVSVTDSIRFGLKYKISDVIGRSNILIHSGNFAGIKTDGYKSDVSGCILFGERFGILNGQRAILSSRIAIKTFMNYLEYDPFILNIICDNELIKSGEY